MRGKKGVFLVIRITEQNSGVKQTSEPLANDYDKILKENIASVFLPLTAKYLGIRIARSEELKDKLQTTIEKEPDFIRIVETDTGSGLFCSWSSRA